MPADFPTSLVLQCPSSRTLSMPTRVIEMLDGTEQRWAAGDPRNAFELRFEDVVAADVVTVANWFDTVKGAFDSTWSLTWMDGTTYAGMGLEDDVLTALESAKAERYSFTLKMRQVAAASLSASASAVYPALPNGVYTQRPFGASRAWSTTRNDLESGARVAWAEWAAAKRSWSCEYPVLTETEVGTRVTFFVAMRGRLGGFTFHDPRTGSDVTHCRFDQDALIVRCMGAGQWSTTVAITEYFV